MEIFSAWSLFQYVGPVWLIAEWIIRIASVFIVPRNRKPTAGTSWLLFIFFFPFLGILVFLFLGNPKLPKSRRNAQKTLNSFIAKTVKLFQHTRDSKKLLSASAPPKYQPIARLSENLTHLPVFDGNKIKVLPEYDAVITSIAKDIDSAKYFVHLEYFIFFMDDVTLPIFDALARAVKRGVIVRVLYDSFSTRRYKGWKNTIQRLKSDGVHVQPMLPLRFPGKGYVRPDLRNHRKLVVIDGSTGYTGSQNMIQRNYHPS